MKSANCRNGRPVSHRLSAAALLIAALLPMTTVSAWAAANDTVDSGHNMPHTLQDTLKNIPAAGAACMKDDLIEKDRPAAKAVGRKPDRSCAMTLEQLSPLQGKPDTVLVDVRPKASFDFFHIDGALNMNTADIRTKAFLADKLVVMVGHGKADSELYEVCGELKAAGFKQVRVLKGGILDWVLENRPVIGQTPHLEDLARLTVAELFQEGKSADTILIGWANGRKLSDVLPFAANLTSGDVAGVKSIVQKRRNKSSLQSVILVADERFGQNQLRDLADAVKPVTLRVYAGTEAEYRQFLRVQNAMWAKQAKGPTKPVCGRL